MHLLLCLAETKNFQSNHEVFKSLVSTNQNRALLMKKSFVLFDIKQSESSFNGHGIFNKFKINQSELSSTSHAFFNNNSIKQPNFSSLVIFVVKTNQNEVFTDFKLLYRSFSNFVYETSQSINFIEFFLT